MSKIDLIKEMEGELLRLNRAIDLKIVRGFPYKREAKRHKFLASQLGDLMAEQGSHWNRIASVLSTFVF